MKLRKSFKYYQTVRVSVGDIFLPFLTLGVVDGGYYAILHEKNRLPSYQDYQKQRHTLSYKVIPISRDVGRVLNKALESYESSKLVGINPYSYIVGFAEAKGYDLLKLGVFEN